MEQDRARIALSLAPLMHDIGKFKQRAGCLEDRGKSHEQIGYEWLKEYYGEGIVAAGARNHHGHEEETWRSNLSMIIYEADNCAASERRTQFDKHEDVGQAWQREVQLATVFSRVRNPHDDNTHGKAAPAGYYPLATVDSWSPARPAEGRNGKEQYASLWEGFQEELRALAEQGNHWNIDAVLHLLEKYTSYIPSITLKVHGADDAATYRKHPDVSLFDHLKTTAAVALCLHDFYRERYADRWDRALLKEEIVGGHSWQTEAEHPFLLVGGDLSGVQRFIYTISSKGALKSLKGRSFFLELLTEHVVDSLLEAMSLTRCSVIFTGGGHFYLIAPATQSNERAVAEVRHAINSYLLDDFNGALQQFIELVSFGKGELKQISSVWKSLATLLEKAKQRKWEHHLDRLLEPPVAPHTDCLESNCQVCGREDQKLVPLKDSDVLVCRPCHDQYNLGELLQSSTRRGDFPLIYRWDQRPDIDDRRYLRIGDRYYQPVVGSFGRRKAEIAEAASAVWHLNDWNLASYTHRHSRPLCAAVALPQEEECHDLEGMVRKGFGIERLAVVRMDADRLGQIFSTSIPEEQRTLSLIASLSRQLSLFFKYHLNGLMSGAEGYPEPCRIVPRPLSERRASSVYAGGDDLFLIGQWLDIIECAFDINAAFSAFTGNPFITLSAGITVADPHEPVYRMAARAGAAESLAKQAGRKALTIMDRNTLKWDEAAQLLGLIGILGDFAQPLQDRIELPAGSVSIGFFYRFLGLVRKQRQLGGWMIPKLAYLFGRSRPKEEFAQAWSSLSQYVFSKVADWRQLELALLWLLMMMRKRGEEQ